MGVVHETKFCYVCKKTKAESQFPRNLNNTKTLGYCLQCGPLVKAKAASDAAKVEKAERVAAKKAEAARKKEEKERKQEEGRRKREEKAAAAEAASAVAAASPAPPPHSEDGSSSKPAQKETEGDVKMEELLQAQFEKYYSFFLTKCSHSITTKTSPRRVV